MAHKANFSLARQQGVTGLYSANENAVTIISYFAHFPTRRRAANNPSHRRAPLRHGHAANEKGARKRTAGARKKGKADAADLARYER